jgi:two-component system, NarL family, response regulator LiaR
VGASTIYPPENAVIFGLRMKTFTIKYIFLYAVAIAVIILLLQWMQFRFLVIDHLTEVYVLCIAVLFTAIGIWIAKMLTRSGTNIIKETVVVEKEVMVYKTADSVPDKQMISELGISQREIEVLQLMAAGATNQEIADQLFLSLNTIKTHTSRIFEKLDVKRRTQAIEKARKLNIIL